MPFKVFGFVAALCWGGSVMYSRLFLGVHSIDQVVYGCCIGVWCAFLMQFCVKDHLMLEVKELNSDQVRDFKFRFWMCWLVYAIVEGGQIIEYAAVNAIIINNNDNLPDWPVNIEKAGCHYSP